MSAAVDILTKLQAAQIDIDQSRCVRVRHRRAVCRKCADACVSGCIGYDDNELVITPEKCIGCGTCASVCPTDALRPRKPSDAELHARCMASLEANDGRVVIACQDMLNAADGLFDPERLASVPCLGRIDDTLIVRLVAAGARRITFVEGACEQCQNIRGREVFDDSLASAELVLEVWKSEPDLRVSEKLPKYTRAVDLDFDPGKRAFFSAAKNEAKGAAVAVVDVTLTDKFGMPPEDETPRFQALRADANGNLPHSISPRRKAFMAALDFLAEEAGGVEDVMIETPLWSEVLIDQAACNGCRMCASFCPSGANFKFSTKDGRIGVKHRVRQCVNCRLCEDVCFADALSFSDEVFATDVANSVVERFVLAGREDDRTKENMLFSMRGMFKDGGAHVVQA